MKQPRNEYFSNRNRPGKCRGDFDWGGENVITICLSGTESWDTDANSPGRDGRTERPNGITRVLIPF